MTGKFLQDRCFAFRYHMSHTTGSLFLADAFEIKTRTRPVPDRVAACVQVPSGNR